MADRTVVIRLLANIGDFQAKMGAAEKAVRGVGRSTKDTEKQSQDALGKLAKHAKDNEQAWRDVGGAFLGVGVAAGAGLTAAAVSFASFDRQMSAVQAATLATSAEMDGLRDAAVKAGADTAFSANEAAQGIEELAKAGISTRDIIGGGLTGALDLAAAGGLDVGRAAEIAATAVTQFGLEGKDVVGVADALAAGANKAQGSVEDLGLALSYAGVPANALGVSVEETTGVLGLFANAGIIGEKAGTALRAMLVSLQNPSAKAGELMDELGIEVFDANGKFIGMEATAGVLQDRLGGLTDEQRGAALATIFGNESLGAATTLYRGGSAAVEQWTDAVSESGYAAEVAATRLDNLYGDVEALGGSFESLLIKLGEGSNGPLRSLTQDATTMVNAFADAPDAFQQVTVGAGLATTAVGLLGGAAFLAIPKVVAANTALAAMGPAGAKAAAGLGAASRALVAFSAPLAILTGGGLVALDYWADNEQAIDSYRDSLNQATGAVTDFTREQARSILLDAGVGDAARELGLSMDTITSAATGNADAIAEVDAVLADHNTKVGEGTGLYGAWMAFADKTTITMDKQGEAAAVVARQLGIQNERLDESRDSLGLQAAATEESRAALFGLNTELGATSVLAPQVAEGVDPMLAAIEETGTQSDEAAEAVAKWREQLAGVAEAFSEPLSTYTEMLTQKEDAERESAQATADATESAEDSWEDYVDGVAVSLDEYAAKLEEQNAAQETWRANLVTISQRGGTEVASILATMGAEGAQITADLATATDEDFTRMADALIADARFGGAGAAAALDEEMKVMELVGKDGAGRTVTGIADQLKIGTDRVREIAAQYGIRLAEGINPLLNAIGKDGVRPVLISTRENKRMADGGFHEDHVAQIAPAGAWRVWAEPETGGEAYIPLAPSKRKRSLEIYREAGKRLGVDTSFENYADGGFSSVSGIPTPRSTAPARPPVSTAGDATMRRAYDEVRALVEENSFGGQVIPGGAKDLVGIGRLLQSMGARVSEHPAFGGVNGRHSPTSLHYKGRAIDVNYGPGGANATENAFMRNVIPQLREMASFRQLYYREIGGRTDHDDHLHLGMAKGGILNPHVRDQGGPLLPGFTYNGTGRNETVVTDQQAAYTRSLAMAPTQTVRAITVQADSAVLRTYGADIARQVLREAEMLDAVAASA